MTIKPFAACLLALSVWTHPAAARGDQSSPDLTLWYRQPAPDGKAMEEALPIGNGRMGALVFGAPARERLNLNENSLWTGGENPSGDYDTMGAYQVLGNLYVNLPGHTNAANYRRDLNLATAVAGVGYSLGDVRFERQFFCSHPAGVLVADFKADRKGVYTGSIGLEDAHGAVLRADGDRLAASGQLDNGMKFEWQVRVLHQGGTLTLIPDAHSPRLEFKECDRLTLLVGAGTDYTFAYTNRYHGDDPRARVTSRIDMAARKSVSKLLAEHLRDFQALFNRVGVDFGRTAEARRSLPTDQRKLEAARTADPGLEALQFQYGRYLLISCSRPGGLPANLQGLWNDNNNPPWHSDYHADINIQMNYWPAEVGALGECQTPFFDLIASQLPAWRRATAAAEEFKTADGRFATRGFAIRTSHNITGGMGWQWDKTANAWYCQHLWEHYAFGRDQSYLRATAYPIIKETCEFWEDHLKALPDGKLVVPNGWSPEHGPVEDGVSYNQEIVWDLFNNYVHAADALGADREYRDKIAGLRDRLVVPGIGSWGQLLEWMHEKHDPQAPELDTPRDHHRHTSPLFALFPGAQISVAQTPALAAASKVLLDARGIDSGSDVREWSFAWRTALYARLRDAADAHNMLQHFFSARNSSPNLFGLHPPVQLDGNFGLSAGIAEMLLQSQAGRIELLPALPKAWPVGDVTGLRARGGYEIGLHWQDGKLLAASVQNLAGDGHCQICYGDKLLDLSLKPGQVKKLNGDLQ